MEENTEKKENRTATSILYQKGFLEMFQGCSRLFCTLSVPALQKAAVLWAHTHVRKAMEVEHHVATEHADP